MSGAHLWQTMIVPGESPAFPADLAVPSEQVSSVGRAQLPLAPPFSLVGPWLLSKIDACNRRAANSIYSVLILFNPIHISASKSWQDVRSYSESREKFL